MVFGVSINKQEATKKELSFIEDYLTSVSKSGSHTMNKSGNEAAGSFFSVNTKKLDDMWVFDLQLLVTRLFFFIPIKLVLVGFVLFGWHSAYWFVLFPLIFLVFWMDVFYFFLMKLGLRRKGIDSGLITYVRKDEVARRLMSDGTN